MEKAEADNHPVAFVPDAPDETWNYVYEVVGFRRQTSETMAWQAPIMSLTAQAFLMMIALGPGYSRLARFIAALISIATNLASWQTMARHRMFEHEDAKWLNQYERRIRGEQDDPRPLPHDRLAIAKGAAEKCRKSKKFYARCLGFKAFHLWTIITVIFAAVSLWIMFSSVFDCIKPW